MDAKKQAKFTRTMGRGKRKFARGGLIRKIGDRHYFDNGGVALSGPSNGATNQNASNANSGILGTIGGAFGLNDNFQAGAANIQAGTNANQLNAAYTGAQTGLTNQGQLVGQLQPQVANAVAGQNAVENQQIGIMNGTGPNPAQTALAQNTAANVANQAALMAGQRGASANPGLIAREAAQQGAATQQQAVGQGATLEAQQQIAAGQNAAAIAAQQVAQAQGATTAQNQAEQGEQGILQGANTAYNNAATGMQENINSVNAQTAMANQTANQGLFGGLTSAGSAIFGAGSGGGAALSGLAAAFAEGGRVCDGPHGHVASYLYATGGKVPAMVSPGEIYLNPEQVQRVVRDGEDPAKIGRKFSGKAKVKGDSLKNDTIPKDLEEGGVVIDRNNMSTREKRELFVHRAIARKRARAA